MECNILQYLDIDELELCDDNFKPVRSFNVILTWSAVLLTALNITGK